MAVYVAMSMVFFDGADQNDAWAKGQAEWIHDNTKVLTGQALVVPGTAGERSSYCQVYEVGPDGVMGSWSNDATPVWQPGVPTKAWYVNDIGLVTDGTPQGTGQEPSTPASYPDWAISTSYLVDDVVTYNAANYRCIQAHTSQAGWEPDVTPALWTAI